MSIGPIAAARRRSAGGGIPHETAEVLGAVNEAAGTFSDLVSLTASQMSASKKYLILWTTETANSASDLCAAQLLINGSAVVSEQDNREIGGATKQSAGGVYVYDSAGGTTPVIKIQGKRVTTGTATFTNSRISYIELGADDYFTNGSTTRQTTSSTTTGLNAGTLTFTPASTGNYVALISCLVDTTSTSVRPIITISDGTTTLSFTLMANAVATTPKNPVVIAWPMTSVSGSTTITVNIKATTAATVGISDIRMCALREDRFVNVYKSVLGANDTGTQSVITVSFSQTFTPRAKDHLAFSAWLIDCTTASTNTTGQFDDNGTIVDAVIRRPAATSATGPGSGFGQRIANYASTSRTQSVERKNASGASHTMDAGSAIVTFDLG